jgi:hypothetical protein
MIVLLYAKPETLTAFGNPPILPIIQDGLWGHQKSSENLRFNISKSSLYIP